MSTSNDLAHDIDVVIALSNPVRLNILLALYNSEVLKIGPEFKRKRGD